MLTLIDTEPRVAPDTRRQPRHGMTRLAGIRRCWLLKGPKLLLGRPRLPAMAIINSAPVGSRRRVVRHVGRLLGGEVTSKTLRFVATVVLARTASPSAFGLINVAIAISGLALVATSLGLPDLAARDVAVEPKNAGWLLGHVGTTRLAAVACMTAVGLPLGLVIWPGHTLLLVVAALMAAFMSVSGDWMARGLERTSLFASASATGGATLVVAVVILSRVSRSAVAGLAAFAVAEGAAAVLLLQRLTRGIDLRIGVRGMRRMLRRARPLAFSSFAIYSYYANLDTLILAASHSVREAGLYSAPYRLFLVFNVVAIFAAFAMLPSLVQLAAGSSALSANKFIQSMLRLLGGYGLAILGIIEIIGRPILGILFGAEFRVAAPTLVLLVASVSWYAIGYPAGYSLIAAEKGGRFLVGAAMASILGTTLDVILIPPMGMKGAGLATMIAFAASSVVWLRARGLIDRHTVPILAAAAGSTVGSLGIVFWGWSTAVVATPTLLVAGLFLLSSMDLRHGRPLRAVARS